MAISFNNPTFFILEYFLFGGKGEMGGGEHGGWCEVYFCIYLGP